ncbi:ompA-like transmembrane domain protein [Hydrogenophaga sp. RAC07]|uniref:OmpA family protein n=1 Tax=Hydrogenophaga sp. RAC07 TaxID=1842537 RepID=UPI00083E698E|nr:OmpA family protein [Hydrogenophaga sp. RAC07]AOF86476.1 ompA-like transmembrane domain protein [Hydrogenophaga sp. RAC07]
MKPTLNTSAGALSLLTLAFFAHPLATAQSTGWYAGANAGRTGAEIDDPRITSGLQAQGFTTTSINDRDRSTGFKLFGGYQFSPHFALEGGYFDLGKFGYTANTIPTGTLNGEMRVRGLNLDLVGSLPLTGKLSALGRVGVNYARANDRFSGTGAVNVSNPTASKSQANAKYGVGLNYAFSDAMAMRLELERYRVNDAIGNKGDIDMLSVGLVYRFGGPAPQPVRMAAAPMPMPVVVQPPPAVVQAPPPPPPPAPMPQRVSLSAESLFGFDASTVKPEGRAELDKFARDLTGTNYQTVVVEGHTDHLGSDAYNQKLSEERANAVKDHLVTNGRLDSSKISAVGKGETQPVTKPGDCKGNSRTAALVACLQPDRRVDVEVTGTR